MSRYLVIAWNGSLHLQETLERSLREWKHWEGLSFIWQLGLYRFEAQPYVGILCPKPLLMALLAELYWSFSSVDYCVQ